MAGGRTVAVLALVLGLGPAACRRELSRADVRAGPDGPAEAPGVARPVGDREDHRTTRAGESSPPSSPRADRAASTRVGPGVAAGADGSFAGTPARREDLITIKLLVDPPKRARVFWGVKDFGLAPLEIRRPRGSGPLDLELRAPGFLTYHTRVFTERDSSLSIHLATEAEAARYFGYRSPDGRADAGSKASPTISPAKTRKTGKTDPASLARAKPASGIEPKTPTVTATATATAAAAARPAPRAAQADSAVAPAPGSREDDGQNGDDAPP
jgi:hypothetical protein